MSVFGRFFGQKPDVPESAQVERAYAAFRAAFMALHGEADGRRRAGDPSLASFIDRYLDDIKIESRICSTGITGMRRTVQSGSECTNGFAIGSSVAVNVQTIPVTQNAAATWYGTQFNGLLGYIDTVLAPVLAGKGFGAFVHVVFGQDIQKCDWQIWSALYVVSTADPRIVSNFFLIRA
jgi:hypothetical protein